MLLTEKPGSDRIYIHLIIVLSSFLDPLTSDKLKKQKDFHSILAFLPLAAPSIFCPSLLPLNSMTIQKPLFFLYFNTTYR